MEGFDSIIESRKFVKAYLDFVDGEKDPRNLMVVFRTLKLISKELNIAEFVCVSYEGVQRPSRLF